MDNAALCRVCLTIGTKMLHIGNTQYQELFEKLLTKMCTADQRPETMCYICFSQLQRCHRFADMSQKAEKILTHLSLNGLQATNETLAEHSIKMKQTLSMAPMKYLFIGDTDTSSQVTVKEEVLLKKEVPEKENLLVDTIYSHNDTDTSSQVTVKEEVILKKEVPEKDNLSIETVLSHNSSNVTVKEEKISVKEEGLAEDKLSVEIVSENSATSERSIKNSECLTFEVDDNDVFKALPSTVDVEKSKPKSTYCCDICSKTFSVKGKLSLHITQSHTRQISLKGSIAEKKFSSCKVCGKIISFKSNLIRHMRVHTGEKPYACDICDKKFAVKSHLIKHKRIHTGEKPYACDVCVKEFSTKTHLTRHKRVHTGEKPYACDICDKEFTTKFSLSTHMRVHTGEKPHACDICGKKFNDRSNLTSHKRVHTGEKPHACDLCGKNFSHKSNLTTHMTVHMNNTLLQNMS